MFDSDPMCTQNEVKGFFCCSSSGLIHFSHEVNICKVWELVNKIVAPRYLCFVEIPLCIGTKPGVGLTNLSTLTTSPVHVATLFSSIFFSISSSPAPTDAPTEIWTHIVQLNLNYHRGSVGIWHYKFCLSWSICVPQYVSIVSFSILPYLWESSKLILAGIWQHTVTLY